MLVGLCLNGSRLQWSRDIEETLIETVSADRQILYCSAFRVVKMGLSRRKAGKRCEIEDSPRHREAAMMGASHACKF